MKNVYIVNFEGMQAFSTARKALKEILSWKWAEKDLVLYSGNGELETVLTYDTLTCLITSLNKHRHLTIEGGRGTVYIQQIKVQ